MLELYTVTKHSARRIRCLRAQAFRAVRVLAGLVLFALGSAASTVGWTQDAPSLRADLAGEAGAAGKADVAGEPEARGLEIFTEADRRQSGYVDMQVSLVMTLRNRKGAAVERELDLKQLEVPAGGDKLMVVFNTPKAIRGTALLSHGQITREDDQWLYLPALKRVKKIASRNRSGPFLGSEFSYEDLSTQEIAKYSYRYLRTEACGEGSCFVVERRPGPNLYSGYLRQLFWIDERDYRSLKVDYFNRGDRLTKSLVSSDFKSFVVGTAPQTAAESESQAPATILKPGRMLMTNHVTGKSTELAWNNFRFGTGLTAERDLSTTSLRRVR